MSKPAPATWVCPICGRRVPKREAECFCGAKQQVAQQHQVQQAKKQSTRIPTDVALLILAVVLVGVYGLRRATKDATESEAPGRNLLAGVAPTTEPPAPAAAPPLPAAPSQAAQESAEPPAIQRAPPPPLPPLQAPAETARAATPPPATAAPAPTPAPPDERAQVRAAGLAAYEAALRRLTDVAARVEENVRVFTQECGDSQKVGSAIGNCPEIEAAIRRDLQQVLRGLDAAEDEARRAWLEPGQVREARGRSVFGSRQWDDIVSAAQRLRR